MICDRPLDRPLPEQEAIAEALSACGTPGFVMCHVSHLYETGASLYFTFLAARRTEDEIGQWHAVKEAASRAITTGGGTITHHHGVGRDHAPWLKDEVGGTGVAALLALKSELDPVGIMNPGKLVPVRCRGGAPVIPELTVGRLDAARQPSRIA